jgi:hypothetical protein
MATVHPSPANLMAVALPIPLAPPVISATLSASNIVVLLILIIESLILSSPFKKGDNKGI